MEFVIILGLIILNGFFSLSEIAIVSSKPLKLRQLEGKKKGAKTAIELKENAERFLSAIQIGITLIGLITGAYSGASFVDDVAPLFRGIPYVNVYANEIAMVLIITVTTYLSIVLGELVPKTIGMSNPEKVACSVAPIVRIVSIIFSPFVRFLSFSTVLVSRLLRVKKTDEQITEEELKLAIETASDVGVIEEEQEVLHKNLFYFADKKVRHIMTNRKDIVWIDIAAPFADVDGKLMASRFSYVLCCEKVLDAVVGVIRIKDYLMLKIGHREHEYKNGIVKPLMVSKNTEAGLILEKFRETGLHFALVINEYAELEGIVTLHDILEHIIGDMPQEGEVLEPDIYIREDKSTLVSGDASIEKLAEVIEGFEVDFDIIDYSTVAGFVCKHIENIPAVGMKFDYAGYEIEIVDIDAHRVDKILVTRKASDSQVPGARHAF